MLFEHE